MKKYEYMMVRRTKSAVSKSLSSIKSTGEETQYKVESFSEGEKEFVALINYLGANGWEFFDSSTNPINGFYTIFAYFRRELAD